VRRRLGRTYRLVDLGIADDDDEGQSEDNEGLLNLSEGQLDLPMDMHYTEGDDLGWGIPGDMGEG
jgi:hypothetical protein